ncbi:hypothetical protein ACT7DH_09450 [Bacillus pacificus]
MKHLAELGIISRHKQFKPVSRWLFSIFICVINHISCHLVESPRTNNDERTVSNAQAPICENDTITIKTSLKKKNVTR